MKCNFLQDKNNKNYTKAYVWEEIKGKKNTRNKSWNKLIQVNSFAEEKKERDSKKRNRSLVVERQWKSITISSIVKDRTKSVKPHDQEYSELLDHPFEVESTEINSPEREGGGLMGVRAGADTKSFSILPQCKMFD
jgi:hypothetical protein